MHVELSKLSDIGSAQKKQTLRGGTCGSADCLDVPASNLHLLGVQHALDKQNVTVPQNGEVTLMDSARIMVAFRTQVFMKWYR